MHILSPMQYATLNVINLEHMQCVTFAIEFTPWLKSGIRDSSVTGQVHISNINAYWVHILICISGAYSCGAYQVHIILPLCRSLRTAIIILTMTNY